MNYKLIQGKFLVRGFSPDGDSIRFVADNKSHQRWFQWTSKSNKDKAAADKEIKMQLRLEAIDALETHYNNKYHQPRSFGIAGMDKLLYLLGIEVVKYSIDYTKITEAVDGKSGFIISSGLDMYERPISFLYSGSPDRPDGAEFTEYPNELIKKSVNYQLLAKGIVYPTFYKGIDENIINEFSKRSKLAKKNGMGLWAIDKTKGFTFWETWTIQDDIIILPKLFRRLASFIDNYSSYNQLSDYFKKSNDQVLILSENKKVNFGDIILIEDRNISLTYDPEDLLFIPKD